MEEILGFKICCDKCKSGQWRTQKFEPSKDIHTILCKNCDWEGSAEELDVILWDWDTPDQERIITDDEYFSKEKIQKQVTTGDKQLFGKRPRMDDEKGSTKHVSKGRTNKRK